MILISIYPDQVKAIKNNKKKYEFRKAPSKKAQIRLTREKYIVVYETKPISAITLIIKIGEIYKDDINLLWEKFGKNSGISRDYFMGYYHGKVKGIAIHIKKKLFLKKSIKLSEIKKLHPKFNPPQNFYELSEEKYPRLYKLLKQRIKNKF